MKRNRVVRLVKSTAFQQPGRWEVQGRYACRMVGPQVVLNPGAWLLELGPVEVGLEASPEYRYRTVEGAILSLAEPLGEEAYVEISDPQAARAMEAYRALGTSMVEELGVSLYRISSSLPPFALIRCPLCAGTAFTSVDAASVWCDGCNARFFVRATAGDRGFVVDVTWETYDPTAAFYILPSTRTLRATLVLKDSGDPRDLRPESCDNGCKPGAVHLTDGRRGLRAGLHACKIGTLYDWRIYGEVPGGEDLQEDEHWEVNGLLWPRCATMRVLLLDFAERQALVEAQSALQVNLSEAANLLLALLDAPSRPPEVLGVSFPDAGLLAEGERYLLHHWLEAPRPADRWGWSAAWPVWVVVVPRLEDQRLAGWEVLRKNICPICARPVTRRADETNLHAACQEIWTKLGWQPQSE